MASQKEKKADKSRLKKVTFQISTSVLEPLDRLHLQLQLELGKKDAPYKEVIVEEAISNLLEMSEQDRNQLVESLLKRQSQRALKSKAWNQKSSGKKDR